jgi:hypothetical protein
VTRSASGEGAGCGGYGDKWVEKRPVLSRFMEARLSSALATPTVSTTDLVRFLLARIEDDAAQIKRYNRAAASGKAPAPGWYSAERMRAECEAKRQVIGTLQQQLVLRDQPFEKAIRHQAISMLRALALPYAEHVAYRKEWALSAPL